MFHDWTSEMWNHWKLSHWTAFCDWKLQRFWFFSLQLFLQCSWQRAGFWTCLLRDLTKKTHCIMLSTLLSRVILKQLLVFPEVFLTECNKGKCSIFCCFWVCHISLFIFPRMPNNMEYKISNITSFKGTAPGNQWTSEFSLYFVAHKPSLSAYGTIERRPANCSYGSGRAVNASFWNKTNMANWWPVFVIISKQEHGLAKSVVILYFWFLLALFGENEISWYLLHSESLQVTMVQNIQLSIIRELEPN